ncbi:hypothetical protein K3495_g7793 [Podosphaera aphanis]|nr:hypothetical protein K3495_g7793 [Podosphaera aphanis]
MYDPLKDITLGQLVDEKQHTIAFQRIEIPETDVPLDLDLYICSSVPLFQATYNINGYPTPSPTVSREQTCEIEEESIGLSNSLDALEFVNLASANEYLLAFSSVVVQKQEPIEKQIHRDQLPPPPKTWKESMKHPFKNRIMAATCLEFNHLMQDTLEVENSYNGHAVPLKWIWTYKFDPQGFLTKFKCRLCVRGDLQLPTLKDTYAATLAMKTFRSMMALMCAFGLESRQYDLVNTFCNTKLSPLIYCKTPPGFEHLGKTLKVKQALYGLRESALLWSRTLKQTLNNLGYEDVPGVDCLMRGHNTILLIYVDDIILLYWPHYFVKVNEFENHLSSRLKITSCGEAK